MKMIDLLWGGRRYEAREAALIDRNDALKQQLKVILADRDYWKEAYRALVNAREAQKRPWWRLPR